MAESGEKKGTVTALGSLFPADEAQKASKLVQDAISDRRLELDRLRSFAADNAALAKLVRQLPDEISHDIMVPFGSAAFFPGRLIHTNEFLVLLGDGYYADRTSKQTVEILKRREKSLESQMEALKASLLDLETEAKFFDSTAAEAEEGIVEIREDYTEEPSEQQEDFVDIREGYFEAPQNESKLGTSIMSTENDEHDQVMARLAELETEELEAGSASEGDEDAEPESEVEAESTSGSENGDSEDGVDFSAFRNHVDDGEGKPLEKSELKQPVEEPRDQELPQSTAKSVNGGSRQCLVDRPSVSNPNLTSLTGDGSVKSNIVWSHDKCKPPLPAEPKDSSESFSLGKGKIVSSDRKAFTGSIIGSVVEHTHGLPLNHSAQSTSSEQPTKPVSRFKMMKGNR